MQGEPFSRFWRTEQIACAVHHQGRAPYPSGLIAQIDRAQQFQAGGQVRRFRLRLRAQLFPQLALHRARGITAARLQGKKTQQGGAEVLGQGMRKFVQQRRRHGVRPIGPGGKRGGRAHQHQARHLVRMPRRQRLCHHATQRPADEGGRSRNARGHGIG